MASHVVVVVNFPLDIILQPVVALWADVRLVTATGVAKGHELVHIHVLHIYRSGVNF